ncbi:MAG: hypothetical protein ACP5OG_02580 [Candidatus Nanoarchaeia archaeon]
MKTKKRELKILALLVVFTISIISIISFVSAADPEGPTQVTIVSNTTKSTLNPYNVSTVPGGYIAHLNITANLRNPRWKAFVGWITGKFSLADSAGSRIYEWELSVTNGNVYATRAASTIAWASVNCSNLSKLELENYEMNHTNVDDNISATFDIKNHSAFYVAGRLMDTNLCYTLHPYVENATSYAFDEMVLDDGENIIFATPFEENQLGYNSELYDFQMLVPENGASTFSGITPYYLYVEVS